LSTKTHTVTTHYHIQKKRRAEFIDEWRKYRQTVIRKEDVALVPTARGLRTGVYMGWDGDRPTRCLDALVHEIDPGTVTTIHRHSWDAILFMVEGSGWTEVDGVRYDWKPWDAIHLPAWSWHRHGNDGDRSGRFMSYSSEPTLWTLGMSLLEDAGHEPFASLSSRPPVSSGVPGNDPYARRLRRIDQETKNAAPAGSIRPTTSRRSSRRLAARVRSSSTTVPSATRRRASRR
jgi:gentisate 1,2-dioxygenase